MQIAGKRIFVFLYTVIFSLGLTFGISGDGTVKGILGVFVLITVFILFGTKAKIEDIYSKNLKEETVIILYFIKHMTETILIII